MSKDITITVNTNQKLKPLRTVYSSLFTITVIGVGAVLESAAMQWIGFIVVIITALGVVMAGAGKNSNLTIDEARKRLDELEAKEVDC